MKITPLFARKALDFYNKNLAIQKDEEFNTQTIRSFNQHLECNITEQEFEVLVQSIAYAKELANTLKKNIDYIESEDHSIKFLDDFHRIQYSSPLKDDVHVFLEEVLRSKGVIGLKIQNDEVNYSYTSKKSIHNFFKDFQNLNIGVSGTVSSKEELPLKNKK